MLILNIQPNTDLYIKEKMIFRHRWHVSYFYISKFNVFFVLASVAREWERGGNSCSITFGRENREPKWSDFGRDNRIRTTTLGDKTTISANREPVYSDFNVFLGWEIIRAFTPLCFNCWESLWCFSVCCGV